MILIPLLVRVYLSKANPFPLSSPLTCKPKRKKLEVLILSNITTKIGKRRSSFFSSIELLLSSKRWNGSDHRRRPPPAALTTSPSASYEAPSFSRSFTVTFASLTPTTLFSEKSIELVIIGEVWGWYSLYVSSLCLAPLKTLPSYHGMTDSELETARTLMHH